MDGTNGTWSIDLNTKIITFAPTAQTDFDKHATLSYTLTNGQASSTSTIAVGMADRANAVAMPTDKP